MSPGVWLLVLWSVGIVVAGFVWLVWGLEKGQFDDLEETKYRMLEDREPEGWPGRRPRPQLGRAHRMPKRGED